MGNTTVAAPFREFEFSEGKSNKFWRIAVNGKEVTTFYGPIGRNGQSTINKYKTPLEAREKADDLIASKIAKKYVEYTGDKAAGTWAKKQQEYSLRRAMKFIVEGNAPVGMYVDSGLDFSSEKKKFVLPEGLSVWRINVSGKTWLKELPPGLKCFELDATRTSIVSIPEDIRVEFKLDGSGCRFLKQLPAGLKVGSLSLAGCQALTSLPQGLDVSYLDISGCTRLEKFPTKGAIRNGRLTARNCVRLKRLPGWLQQISQLDISGCENIKSLPRGLKVSGWIDVGGSGLKSLPKSLRDIEIRWRGATVNYRIAFQPEKITAKEVLAEENVELRRAMLDSMGFERFIREADAKVLDTDVDGGGGPRELLKVKISGDEDLVCVSVVCPSTSRQYLIRVPPRTKTCKQAVAWTAGFSNADDYQPQIET